MKFDKQDQHGKAAFKERNPHTTQQQEPAARSPGGPQTKTGQGTSEDWVYGEKEKEKQSTCLDFDMYQLLIFGK
jgi:hypothetical protein